MDADYDQKHTRAMDNLYARDLYQIAPRSSDPEHREAVMYDGQLTRDLRLGLTVD